MRIAIVENTEVTHHGQLGVALHEAAAVIDLYKPFRDGGLPRPGSFDALVVFGGEQSALDDATHPHLAPLAGLMAETAAQGTAVLGICLGAQLFARGLGAENRLGVAPEFGWVQVERLASDPVLAPDPVLKAAPEVFPIFQWHSDTFSLPPGALHLARSQGAAIQAFRFGRAGYGTQFHFEASCAVARDWLRRFPEACDAMSPGWSGQIEAEAAAVGRAADEHGLALARAWVALI
ncbi:type 1 glutamine amidotransferase [Rhodobacter sp. KR11]|jgi:GMP synthase (glutamine-hydrolysing)|uniref:type 1 glutamine amidotransferase n=1 Tax=Rhodobacter sp. KR11 TaxID=2974588 RepID=UPI0022229020|nr:type 1 glutamine amidotransferase [Rhodobacter sp. KR11]MCW1919573.1 type 1 glutamine amidotransferase [Rhodobacter sp. KR11]